MDSPLHITGIFGKNLYANVQVSKRIYSFVKKLEDATKINLKTCMKCRTDGSNFVNKIRMKCVFLLHKRTPIQKQVEKNRQFTFVRLSFWHKNAPFR